MQLIRYTLLVMGVLMMCSSIGFASESSMTILVKQYTGNCDKIHVGLFVNYFKTGRIDRTDQKNNQCQNMKEKAWYKMVHNEEIVSVE